MLQSLRLEREWGSRFHTAFNGEIGSTQLALRSKAVTGWDACLAQGVV